ncbi:MAG: sulfatase-like hydrolase/transferase [Opitutales bacterium]
MQKRLFIILSLAITSIWAKGETERPNVLWIVSEDNGQLLGCYGDENANTPHLDKLATNGIRYTNSYANAPVCAVARSSWIFGTPAVSTGTLHMRSKYLVPRDTFRAYPEVFRDAGYYVTNNSKTDYNTHSIDSKKIWHESSRKAHYKNREEGQPFFAIFNIGQSHESGIFKAASRQSENFRVKPEDVNLPPYQADTPETRKDWQFYYERLELMDELVGKRISELEELGVAENTIILYCSDHGGITLRSKRFLHDSGTRIPLIAYFPEKWKHLAPEEAGTVSDRLVQFIDMPKTWLNLAGIEAPDTMTGNVFLGENVDPPPDSVFLFSGRFDESPDNSRAVTDGRWKYIRNFESDRLRFQMLTYPMRHEGQRSQWEAYDSGDLNAHQSAQYMPQPAEELYDTLNDPHEVNNLAANEPAILAKMRERLREHVFENRDLGFIPEPLMVRINESASTTIFEWGQSEANYPLERVYDLALKASDKNPENLNTFIAVLSDPNTSIRYWGAVGIRALGENAKPAQGALRKALRDEALSVRIPAAVALAKQGARDEMLAFLLEAFKSAENDIQGAWALDGIKLLDAPEVLQAHDPAKLLALAKGNYSKRIIEVLLAEGSAYKMPNKKL